MSHCTEQRFLEDVKGHVMTVIREDGIYRHIRFARPGTSCMHFDLITWPGLLCYTGDMGTYVFRRLEDMFQFFRFDPDSSYLKRHGLTLGINEGYWSEKVQSDSRYGRGTQEWSDDKFKAALKRDFDQHFESLEPDDEATAEEKAAHATRMAEAWLAVEGEILSVESLEHDGYRAVQDFEHDGLRFRDFWEHTFTDYTFHFTWCCYALAWGIKQYDDAKAAKPVEVPA